MIAPVSIAHTHVYSLRILSGAEALVARVLTTEGGAGYGFTLNLDAATARDMAVWDALARSRSVPLYALIGGCRRSSVAVESDGGRGTLLRVDPFAVGSVEGVLTIAARAEGALALVAPNAHPWEIAYCAALAAAYAGSDVRIVSPAEPPFASIAVPEVPGVGVDWSLEPAFAAIRW
ncbi:MAG: hypothetical protein HYX46_06165 [Betaproteobacteria bacterium]|nr:hypothetical protein [Betaproteobacteria bacterium]